MVENAERPGSRSVAKLRAVPGMAILSDLGTNAPIRGMRNVEGLLVVVSGNSLFTVDRLGAVTNVGTIPGVLRTKMTHNQIAGGNEVAIPADGLGYVYNTHTGELKQITDDGFLGVNTFDYIDSYVVGVEPRGRFAFTSDLADATSYNTLDRVEAESSPDLIVGHIVNHEEWWLCGQTTIEPFVNDGSATGTFKRQGGTVIQRGVASAHCMSLLDNAVFAVGDDGVVYRFDGYTPVRISTMPIEQALSECNLALCFSFTFEDQGHKIYYITCPDGYTWGYDVASKEWHRRASKGLKRWRLNDLVKWNGRWIGGDFSNGKLYQLDWGLASDVNDELVRDRSIGVIHDNQNAVIIDGLELVVDTGKSSAPEFATYVLTIKGDLPDGNLGDTVDFSYKIQSSLQPCVTTISSGALPDGLSMDSSGHVTGTYTTADTYSWTIEVTDGAGHVKTLDDSNQVAGIACSAATAYDGGESYPAEVTVGLGTGLGEVTLRFTTGPVPDKCEVWLDGTKVIDTGYIGDTSEQSALNSALAAKGDAPETITQRTGTTTDANTDWAAGEWDTFTFTKSTTAATATVKVYAPMDSTIWNFALSCPGS